MSNFNILVADDLAKAGLKTLESAARVDNRAGITSEELINCLCTCDALIVRSRTRVDSNIIGNAQRLKVIGRAGVGTDNIDLNAARAKDIIVVNAPLANTVAVAEFTIGLILAILRGIPRANTSLKNGHWLKNEIVGQELCGKILGIIGFGNIGKSVASIANAMGATVLASDPHLPPEMIRERNALPVSLESLSTQSDLISLHTPLTDETRNMINHQLLQQMKVGVYIICTARGGVIDEEALYMALEGGKVAGAALDVYAMEPPGRSPLVTHPNVINTPHIGAQTIEAQERVAIHIAEEVLSALRGGTLRWRVA